MPWKRVSRSCTYLHETVSVCGPAAAADILQYDYENDYDKVDTQPIGTLTEAFYAAADVLSLQQVCASSLWRIHARSAASL